MSRLYGNPFGRILAPRGMLPHRVNIYRRDNLNDDAGGVIPNPVAIAREVPCWVQAVSGTDTEEFSRKDLVLTDKVIFFDNPNVLNSDILEFGTRKLVVRDAKNDLEMDFVWTVLTTDIARISP